MGFDGLKWRLAQALTCRVPPHRATPTVPALVGDSESWLGGLDLPALSPPQRAEGNQDNQIQRLNGQREVSLILLPLLIRHGRKTARNALFWTQIGPQSDENATSPASAAREVVAARFQRFGARSVGNFSERKISWKLGVDRKRSKRGSTLRKMISLSRSSAALRSHTMTSLSCRKFR